MADAERKTEWRQGCALAADTAVALKLVEPADRAQKVAIVVSHDCDLVQSIYAEPDVEVIAGEIVEKADGNLTFGKNPRKLSLPLERSGSAVHCILRAIDRAKVSKAELFAAAPDPTLSMSPDAKVTLQKWLAARYRRTALPDAFDKRLKDTGLHKQLASILEQNGEHIAALFFVVDEDEKPDGMPYDVVVYLLYSTAHDPSAALAASTKAAAAIAKAFEAKCKSGAVWTNFELLECEAISDDAMTIAMERRMKKWNADHLSLKAEPQGETRD